MCNSVQDPRSNQSKDPNGKEVQILIPQPFMGTIIGTGGSKIKELRTVSGPLTINKYFYCTYLFYAVVVLSTLIACIIAFLLL